MKYISMLILLSVMFLFNDYVYSQSEDDLSKEVICPCMIEYGFNADVKESLNAGADFHPVLKFINAEIKDRLMICNYETVFLSFKNGSDFEFVSFENLKDNWTTNGSAVISYYSSQKFKASILNYIYGDISAAQFDENFQSISLSDPSAANIFLKSGGNIKLNNSQIGFLIERNDVIKMRALAPVTSVPKILVRKKNNTTPDNLKKQ